MSLAGLLNILDDDPRLRDVLARAGAGTDPVDTDLVAPPALRPVLAAALALGGYGGAGSPPMSGGVWGGASPPGGHCSRSRPRPGRPRT